MTLLYTDLIFLDHDTGAHPENPDRLRSVHARLEKTGLLQKCGRGGYEALSEEVLGKVHNPAMIARAKEVARQGGGFLDADTVISRHSFLVALEAAGACVAAVDAVLQGKERTALCLVRPPGHHATPTR